MTDRALHFLVIGDDTLATELESAVTSIVSGRSFIVAARNREEADRKLRQRTPDICLLDVCQDAAALRDFVEQQRLLAPDLLVVGVQAPSSASPTPSDVLLRASHLENAFRWGRVG